MTVGQFRYQAAVQDFREARQRADLQEVLARLTGKSNELLSYDEVAQKLRLATRTERGVQSIPVQAIVGSVSRYADFTRTFLPRRTDDKERWVRIKTAFSDLKGTGMPPIEVYKVGDVYFVLDGNHRVSVARQEGWPSIEAHVIEVQTHVPLTPDVQPDDLIVKAEYADFLQQTGLATLRPDVDLSLTAPGQYAKLKEQIQVHHYFLVQDQQRQVAYQEAAADWYDQVYTPVAEAIHERGILRWFPGRTATDLYLWVAEHCQALQWELGWAIRPEAALTDLAAKGSARAESQEAAPGSWRQARLVDRYLDRLFADILVPLSGTPESWQALEQALAIAQREEAHVHGLHIVAAEAQSRSPAALTLQARFQQQCAAAGVIGSLAIESGEVAPKICQRALLSDLVVLHVAHPPAMGLPSLSSGLRAIIRRSARPLLAVPGELSRLERALLIFDGSPKAKEALFVAAYLGERWRTALTVIALLQGSKVGPSVLDYARRYLEFHELPADFILTTGPLDVFLKTVAERQIDLVLMGGYSVSALEEVMVGSAVNFMLREANCPLLICR
jgi:nucleotide-binding universal stress UspA family protein